MLVPSFLDEYAQLADNFQVILPRHKSPRARGLALGSYPLLKIHLFFFLWFVWIIGISVVKQLYDHISDEAKSDKKKPDERIERRILVAHRMKNSL